MAEQSRNSQRGTMFGLPLDTVSSWANGLYLVALAVAAVASFVIFRVSAEKDRELTRFRAESQERTAQLENETAQAKLEQERLKAQLAWRTLSPEVRDLLTKALSAHPSRMNIEYVANDTEVQYLAIQIANAFTDAKWQIAMKQVTHAGTVVFGLWIPESPYEGTAEARAAFRAAGIPFSTDTPPPAGMGFGGVVENAGSILVGSKPLPQ
jgi:hypothetical protein